MFKCMRVLPLILSCFVSSVSYAIQVDVSTNSDDVYAVGFYVDGNQYGGPGKFYSQSDLPAGALYTFGLRIGGLIFNAEDITCTTVNGGHTAIVLNSDTHATLMYDGNKRCYVETIP